MPELSFLDTIVIPTHLSALPEQEANHSSEREVAVALYVCLCVCSVQYVGAADLVLGDGWNTWVFVTLLLQRNRPLVSKTGLFAQSSSSTFMGVSVWLCHFVFSLTPFPEWTIFIFQVSTWLLWGFPSGIVKSSYLYVCTPVLSVGALPLSVLMKRKSLFITSCWTGPLHSDLPW